MNKRIAIFAIAAAAWLPHADAQTAAGRMYTPGPFTGIEISGTAIVRFVQGPTDQVFVEGGAGAHDDELFEVRDGVLHISPGGSWKFWDGRLQLEVTARDLKRVSISGAADLTAPLPVHVDQLAVDISGAGLARFDQLKAEQLSFRVSGAGDGQMAGVAKDLDVRISGRSAFRGENLMSEHAKVSVSGLGEVKVWATQDLAVSVAGIGTVDYWGAPTVQRSVSGKATLNDRGAKPAAR